MLKSNWLTILVLLTVIVPAALSPQMACSQMGMGTYLLDRVITWDDGTAQHVQIDRSGFFHLDGIEKRLVGMMISLDNPNSKRAWAFWEDNNLAYIDKQLSYLNSIGIKLIRTTFPYCYGNRKNANSEEVAYKRLLDLFYKHKMLVIIGPHAKYLPGFGNLETPDFEIEDGDTLIRWATRLSNIVSQYPNIVAVNVDNELDYKLKAGDNLNVTKDQTYTAANVQAYLMLLTNIFRQKTKAAITHNLMANQIEPEIKQTCLQMVDIPGIDCYGESSEMLDQDLAQFLPWMGLKDGWWCLEIGYAKQTKGQQYVYDASKMQPEMITTAFAHGAAIVVLFWSSDADDPEQAYFKKNGDPTLSLMRIAKQVAGIQTPLED